MMLPFTAALVVCCLSSTLAADGQTAEKNISTNSLVREPPSIDEPVADQLPPRYFIDQSKFEIPCKSSKGQPKPINYIWKWNGITLDLNHQDVTLTANGITIDNARYDRAGSYQCQALNMYGTSLSQLFTLQMAEMGSFPAEKDVQTIHGGIGRHLMVKRVSLKCVPAPTYTWKKVRNVDDESPMILNRNRRIVQDREGNLHFTYLTQSDILSGVYNIYKVDVFNSIIDNTAGGSYTKIVKKADPPAGDSPPQLVYPESASFNVPTKVLEGERMEIQCIFAGYPEVQVTWTGPVTGVLLEGDTVLQVDKMAKEAEGAFTCTGTNGNGGPSQHTIKTEMETIPKFSANGRPAGQTLSEGDTAIFVCQTTAETNPPATVDFMINGELIKDFGERTTVVGIDLGKQLTIIELQRDKDIKVIQCKAQNKHKTLYIDAPLNVLMRTNLTSKSDDQTLEANTTQVVLKCTATTDPTYPLSWAWTRDNKPIDFYADPRLKEAGNSLTVNLADLAPDQIAPYSGEYACNASNGYSSKTGIIILSYYQGGGNTGEVKAAAFPLWIILVIIAAVLLLLIIFLTCCICIQRNKGDSYPVDSKERQHGNDPIDDLEKMNFKEYVRREGEENKAMSEASLTGGDDFRGSVDSLAEYFTDDGKFTEDGSFIGEYVDRKKITLPSASASQA